MASEIAPTPYQPWNAAEAQAIVAACRHQPGALMPILTTLTRRFGHINPEFVPDIAQALNLSRAEVHGVISFYHDFRTSPPGEHIVRICRAESCQAVGAGELEAHAKEVLGVDWHETTADGRYTLEPVYCLGNCACSPAVMIDETLHGRVGPERFDALVDEHLVDENPARCKRGVGMPPGTRLFVPRDAAALSLGADQVARALQVAMPDADIVRNGSFGLFWLEPMIEIEREGKRIAFGPVTDNDVASLVDGDFSADHPLFLGPTEAIPALARQNRLTFARCGIIDPLDLDDYRTHGGFAGLERALAMDSQGMVDALKASGLRGRGGAAFPTGIKWQTVLDCQAEQKYIVCNADEGDSGTFADRMIMEGDPYALIEGMTIAGLATGASRGYIYLRSEYPHARDMLEAAIERASEAGYLGENVAGSGQVFSTGSAHGCRGLHLRRGNRVARIARGQARHDSLQAAAAGRQGAVRSANGGQQCHFAGHGAGDFRKGCQALRQLRPREITWHADHSARRQYPLSRPLRARLRPATCAN
jgi:formate dehydrogenase iron-sulfur subunit